MYFTCFVNKIEIQVILFIFNTNPRFPPFLLYVRCKSGVTCIRRSFRDVPHDRHFAFNINLLFLDLTYVGSMSSVFFFFFFYAVNSTHYIKYPTYNFS